jgi:hypothetical protein
MKASASSFAVGLLLSVAVPAGTALASSDPGEQILIERANYWRAQHRPDLAGAILSKILAVNPSQPDALYQHGMLALEQGNRGEAQQDFDRLRQLAAGDKRAAELLALPVVPPATPAAPAAAPSPAVASPTAARAAALPVVKAAAVAAAPALASAVAAKPAATPAAAQAPAELAVASADSDDLTPAPAPRGTPVAPPRALLASATTMGDAAQARQMASLPAQTLSDGDVGTASMSVAAKPVTGSTDLGFTAQSVQTAQVELQPPAPIGGVARPVNVPPYLPTDTLEIDINRDLALIEAQSNPSLTAGLGFRWHDGTSGTSQLFEFGTPIEATFSPWYTGTARFAVLPVYLDAGSMSTSTLRFFGANPIASAAGLPLSSPGAQNTGGVGLLGGYSYGDFSGQFGTSPLGFAVTNLVGSAAFAPKFLDNTLTVRFEGLRQPVTDSLLSYAGTHTSFASTNVIAPGVFGNNTTWGGVVKTGGHVTAFYDDQMYGAYGGAGLASLTGQNVTENNQLDALLGAYFRPWKTDDWAIRVGVAGYYTSYNRNLGGFTFGQGGYFSPQNLESISFPVEYTGHDGPWSWLAAVSLGVQHFNQDSSPIFPKNPGAQATLVALGGQSFYSGGTSTGLGAALNGQIEYAIDNTLTLGAQASYNNGNDYNEVIGKIYLRKTFDWFAPLASKNDPQSIAARDVPMSRL